MRRPSVVPNRGDWLSFVTFTAINWTVVGAMSLALHLRHVWPGPLLMAVAYAWIYLWLRPRQRQTTTRPVTKPVVVPDRELLSDGDLAWVRRHLDLAGTNLSGLRRASVRIEAEGDEDAD